MVAGAEERLAAIFYKVILNEDNKLEWHGIIDGPQDPMVEVQSEGPQLFVACPV